MKKNIFVFFFALMAPLLIFAQQKEEATTSTGKKVILNPDGTWIAIDASKENFDSVTTNCSKWISTEIDKFNGSSTTAGKKSLIVSTDGGKTGFGILMLLSWKKNELILSITAVGAGNCIDEGAAINILFADGSKLTLSNDAKFNCKGNSVVYFGGIFAKTDQLNELKTKKIQSMRVWTSDSYVERDFTKSNQDEFFNVINCLTK
jgi:hypothetical protein